MVWITLIVAMLIFIYLTRAIENKRAERREHMRERRQELLDRTIEAIQQNDNSQEEKPINSTNGDNVRGNSSN